MHEIPAIIGRYIQGLKTHDVAAIAETIAENLAFVTSTGVLNKTRFLEMLRALYAAFPDWHYDHETPEIRDDVIAVKWRQSGTHNGTHSLPGRAPVAATGKKVVIPQQFFFYKVKDECIVEIRPDPIPGGAPQGIFQQLGVEMSSG
jgi:predicted ester cyclase